MVSLFPLFGWENHGRRQFPKLWREGSMYLYLMWTHYKIWGFWIIGNVRSRVVLWWFFIIQKSFSHWYFESSWSWFWYFLQFHFIQNHCGHVDNFIIIWYNVTRFFIQFGIGTFHHFRICNNGFGNFWLSRSHYALKIEK